MCTSIYFVDFDDTICLHSASINCNKFVNGGNPYTNSVPCSVLAEYLSRQKVKGARVVLLTTSSSYMLEHKKKWCEENFPGLFDDFVGLSIDCTKGQYMQSYLEQIPNEYAEFIDDSREERAEATKVKGLVVRSPQMVLQKEIINTL